MRDAITTTINGKPVRGNARIDGINPATGAVFAHAPDCTRIEPDEAVAAARTAFPARSTRPLPRRQAA